MLDGQAWTWYTTRVIKKVRREHANLRVSQESAVARFVATNFLADQKCALDMSNYVCYQESALARAFRTDQLTSR